MKSVLFFGFLLSSSMAFAAHPASDRVLAMLDEAARIHELNPSAKEQAVCRFIGDFLEVNPITTKLLGNYANHADKNGVAQFFAQAKSLMATKVMPQLNKMAGEEGSYSVSDQASSRGGGAFAVSVRAKAKGKTYNAVAIVSANMKLQDAEYLGFSGVAYAGRELRKDIDALARKSKTPVSDYVRDLKNDKDYVRCP